MQIHDLIKAAMRDKAPQLHAQLTAKGKLTEHVKELADQVAEQTVTLTQADRVREKWDKLGPMECAKKLRMASALNHETALANALEFPLDETSPPRPDETTPSDPMT